MKLTKLMIATVILSTLPMSLYAAAGAAAAPVAASATRVADVERGGAPSPAGAPAATYADSTGQQPVQTSFFSSRSNASFYAGLGIAMLNDRGFTGLMPKGYLGYGMFAGSSKSFYGALELSGGAAPILLSPNQTYRVSSLVALSLIPGYKLNDWLMLYGRLGAQSNRYSRLDSTKSGALYGLGLEVYSTAHWDTRFEYSYASNKNLNQYGIDAIYKFK